MKDQVSENHESFFFVLFCPTGPGSKKKILHKEAAIFSSANLKCTKSNEDFRISMISRLLVSFTQGGDNKIMIPGNKKYFICHLHFRLVGRKVIIALRSGGMDR